MVTVEIGVILFIRKVREIMKPRMIIKIAVDILMTLALLFLMGYHFWGNTAHEWAGAGMFVLFIAHHILNLNWYKSLFKGKYTVFRILQIVIDVLVFVTMLALMYSGIIMSREVFAFLPINGGMALARRLHILGSYWGFILMSLHLGLHWNMLIGYARKIVKIKEISPIRSIIFFLLGLLIGAYGLHGFISRDLLTYMLLKTEFVFMDFGESKLLFYLDYLAMMGLCIFIAHYGSKLIRKLTGKKKEKNTF